MLWQRFATELLPGFEEHRSREGNSHEVAKGPSPVAADLAQPEHRSGVDLAATACNPALASVAFSARDLEGNDHFVAELHPRLGSGLDNCSNKFVPKSEGTGDGEKSACDRAI